MNIFYLSHDVNECATYHVDRHVVKMVTEYAQLLSTAHRILDGTEVIGKSESGRKRTEWRLNDSRNSTFYKATHRNHPSAIWCRSTTENYRWLHKMLVALCKEYTYRYSKVMKIEREGLLFELERVPDNIAHNTFVQPTPAMPLEFIAPADSLKSYRDYYRFGKRHLHAWKNRNTPDWIML